MDSSHLEWNFFPHAGTHPLHNRKPDLEQDANPHRPHPVKVANESEKVCKDQGDDETLRNDNEHLPWLPFP